MPRNPYYQGPVSDHFDGVRFHNLAGEPETDRTYRKCCAGAVPRRAIPGRARCRW
jgi:hypothetical protein